MDETIYAAKVYEYTVRGDVLNCSLKNLTLLKLADDICLLSLKLCLYESLVRYNYVSELVVYLHNLELHCLVYKYVIVSDRFYIYLRAREECLYAEYIHNHTALCAALDITLNNLVLLASLIDSIPRTE